MTNADPSAEYIQESAKAWQQFLQAHDWKELVHHRAPKQSGWGLVWELGNPLRRPNEDLALCDLRRAAFGQPHYHPAGAIELYIVLQGSMLMILGGKESRVQAGDVVVIPSLTAHYAIPDDKLIMGLVSIPPFEPQNYIVLEKSNPAVRFDYGQFVRLTKLAKSQSHA